MGDELIYRWHEKLQLANKQHLTEFCFFYKGTLYISTWSKMKWSMPSKIQLF